MALSRSAMFQALGVIKPEFPKAGIFERTLEIYEGESEAAWRGSYDDAPHGAAWHTSFHASAFPDVDVDRGCARKAVYGLTNAPPTAPSPGWLAAIADAGKDIEVRIVSRWHRAGILLSAPPTARYQTNFVDEDTWLTCSVDAALDLRPNWKWVHPVDVKGKDHQVVEAMQRGEREADAGHVRQIMVQTHFLRRAHERLGFDVMGLEPAKAGSLLYVSRQRPLTMHEVLVEYDPELISAGLNVLLDARVMFEAGVIPDRPKEWRWTEAPCQWCPVKKLCKLDLKQGVTKLEESNVVQHARSVNPAYDFATVRKAVLDRWRDKRPKEVKLDGSQRGDGNGARQRGRAGRRVVR